ncbi:hypothetical protein Ntsu_37210 [Nocardia sp. IFM 10818]
MCRKSIPVKKNPDSTRKTSTPPDTRPIHTWNATTSAIATPRNPSRSSRYGCSDVLSGSRSRVSDPVDNNGPGVAARTVTPTNEPSPPGQHGGACRPDAPAPRPKMPE